MMWGFMFGPLFIMRVFIYLGLDLLCGVLCLGLDLLCGVCVLSLIYYAEF